VRRPRSAGANVMKVLVLTSRFPPNVRGGAEIFAGDVSQALRGRGHEVRVLTERFDCETNGTEPWIQRTLRGVVDSWAGHPGSRRGDPRRLVAFYRQIHSGFNARRIRAAVADFKPDVLFIWEISGIGPVSILRGLRRVQIPIVYHLHNYWWQYINSPQTNFSKARIAWLKRMLIGPVPPLRFTTSMAVSEVVKREYVRVGCPGDRIDIIGTAIAAHFFQPRSRSTETTGRPVLLYVGRLCAEKGVMVALEAVNILAKRDRRDVSFCVYGSGDPSYAAALRDYVHTHGLRELVSFNGLVDQDRLIQAYDGAAIALIPSLWQEPSPLVALEAMARGVPVIASDVGGMRELGDDVACGVLVPPGDAHVLADAIAHLLDSPAERHRMGETGRRVVRERFTVDVRTVEIERHLERALELDARESRWNG
jgi:glycosyltransferase involved in cell wall biosynthesis